MIVHPMRMAEFNAWANSRLHRICAELSEAEYRADRKAFFRSIHGTLNHILLVDMLYRERLEGKEPSQFGSLDEIVHDDLATLTEAQRRMDQFYIDYTKGLSEQDLRDAVGFHVLLEEREYWEVSRQIYFSNLFQHQVHHRGQAHNMLSQTGQQPPPIGFIEFEVEQGVNVLRRAS